MRWKDKLDLYRYGNYDINHGELHSSTFCGGHIVFNEAIDNVVIYKGTKYKDKPYERLINKTKKISLYNDEIYNFLQKCIHHNEKVYDDELKRKRAMFGGRHIRRASTKNKYYGWMACKKADEHLRDTKRTRKGMPIKGRLLIANDDPYYYETKRTHKPSWKNQKWKRQWMNPKKIKEV